MKSWAESLGGINYPLLSDFWPHGAVAERYGVLRQEDGISERAIFVLDRQGIIRYIDVHDIADQPDNDEIINVLRQLEREDAPVDPGALAVSSGVYFDLEDADELSPAEPDAAEAVVEEPEEEEQVPLGRLVLYCARWCKDCKKAKAWLDERGLVYEEVDIDFDMDARAQVRKWANGYLITPTFKVDEEIVLDFDAPKLEAALKKTGHLK